MQITPLCTLKNTTPRKHSQTLYMMLVVIKIWIFVHNNRYLFFFCSWSRYWIYSWVSKTKIFQSFVWMYKVWLKNFQFFLVYNRLNLDIDGYTSTLVSPSLGEKTKCEERCKSLFLSSSDSNLTSIKNSCISSPDKFCTELCLLNF